MLKIEIIVEGTGITDAQKKILLAIAGVTESVATTNTEVPEPKAPVAEEKPKATRTRTPKEAPAPVEAVETTPEVVPTPTPEPVASEGEWTPVEITGNTAEDLANYAKNNANGAYGPAYRGILDAYGVKNFRNIPVDKIAEVKAKLEEVFVNIPRV